MKTLDLKKPTRGLLADVCQEGAKTKQNNIKLENLGLDTYEVPPASVLLVKALEIGAGSANLAKVNDCWWQKTANNVAFNFQEDLVDRKGLASFPC